MARYVVTGAGGFIGSHMVSLLKDRGHEVKAISRTYKKERRDLYNKADIRFEMDISSPKLVEELYGSDAVVHLAADMGGVGYFSQHEYTPFVANMQLDLNVFEACRNARISRMFYASSACIYPTNKGRNPRRTPNYKEEDIFPARADQMYGWEKLMGLMLAQRAPIDARVGILHTIYGPYQSIGGEREKFPTALVRKALDAAKNGTPIELWGDGRQTRTYEYITDACEKIYRVINDEDYYGPVNIGSDKAYSVTDMAKTVCTILGIPQHFIYNKSAPSGTLARGCDNSNFKRWYHYSDEVSLTEGLTRLINYTTKLGDNL